MKWRQKVDQNQQRLLFQSFSLATIIFLCTAEEVSKQFKIWDWEKDKAKAQSLYCTTREAWQSIAKQSVWLFGILQVFRQLQNYFTTNLWMKLFPKAVKWNIIRGDYNKVWLYV